MTSFEFSILNGIIINIRCKDTNVVSPSTTSLAVKSYKSKQLNNLLLSQECWSGKRLTEIIRVTFSNPAFLLFLRES